MTARPGPRPRDLLVGGVVAALVVAGILVTRREPPPPPAPIAAPSAEPTAAGTADRAPGPGTMHQLPQLPTALPADIDLDPARALPLSAAPLRRALALFSVPAGDLLTGPVYALGDDAALRVIDVVPLPPTADSDGNPRSSFSSAALRPGGTHAAFPQRDSVIVVDLTTAAYRVLSVPGGNERVQWHGGRLLVTQGRTTRYLDPATGRVTPAGYDGAGVAAGATAEGPVFDLLDSSGRWRLRAWVDGRESSSVDVLRLPAGGIRPNPAWARHWRVAADLLEFGEQPNPDFTDRAQRVYAIDGHTGRVLRTLLLSTGSPQPRLAGCCAVLGWRDNRTVLIGVVDEVSWVLGWDVQTGRMWQVARITARGGPLALSVDLPAG